jgi:hypothetical protein
MSFTYSALGDPDNAIRLLEWASSPPTDRVEGSLMHTSLESTPDYVALSYVWGTSEATYEILIDGRGKKITENLLNALKALRRTKRLVLSKLWVDDICINQNDDVEKSRQVKIMGKIYEKASQVIIWLGPEDEMSAKAIHQLSWLGTKFGWARELPGDQNAIIRAFVKMMLDENDSNLDIVAIWNFFRREWWHRVWVIQEAVLARDALVVCGSHIIQWADIVKALKAFEWMILYVDSNQKYRQTYSYIGSFYRDVSHFALASSSASGESMGLRELMLFTSMTDSIKATDARDRIYGLLGLLKENERARISVDYSSKNKLSHILTSIAYSLIGENGPDILSYCRTTNLSVSLPSWVPDWTGHIAPVIGGFTTQPPVYDASKGYQWQPTEFSVTSGFSKLTLKARVLGNIAAIGEEFTAAPTLPGSEFVLACRSWLVGIEALIDSQSSESNSDQLNSAKRNSWRIPIADMGVLSRAGETAQFIEAYERLKGRQALPSDEAGYEQLISQTWDYRRVWKAYNRRPIILTCTAPGLAPKEAIAGDLIVVLLGGHVPFVLRKVGASYVLIGSAYVYGFMDGEALAPNSELIDVTLV